MDDWCLSSSSKLEEVTKQICSSCGKSRKYFCYDCRVYMPGVAELSPKVDLPVRVDIIKHPKEKNAKSTALHCLLLAPSSTFLFDAPNVFDYRLSESTSHNTVLVYPEEDATTVEEYVKKKGPISRFVFLDATWFQVGGIRMLPEIQDLPTVKLKSYKTLFWRPQKGYSDEHLATIEAIYYAIRESYEASATVPYSGQFDDLLFWFFFFRSKIDNDVFLKNLNSRDAL